MRIGPEDNKRKINKIKEIFRVCGALNVKQVTDALERQRQAVHQITSESITKGREWSSMVNKSCWFLNCSSSVSLINT